MINSKTLDDFVSVIKQEQQQPQVSQQFIPGEMEKIRNLTMDIRVNISIIPFLIFIIIPIFLKFKPIEILGIFSSLVLIFHVGTKILTGIYTTWIGKYLGHYVDVRTLGKWAVVTGGTDGIGLAYCRELARLGLNVVLISRTKSRLEDCAREIEKRFGVNTKCIPVDFSMGPENYEALIRDELQHLEIGLLINNVGKAYDYPQQFHEATRSLEFSTAMINVNIQAVTVMTAIVLPQMLERNKGAIMNIGSLTSYFGFAYFSMYSATKAYMQMLTHDLQIEYKNTGVLFQYQCPSYITSKISKISKSSFLVPTPKQYVKVALKTLGLQSYSSIWPWHRIIMPLIDCGNLVAPNAVEMAKYTLSRSFWLKTSLKRFKKQMNKEALKYQ